MSNDQSLTFEQQDEFNRGPIAARLIQLLENKINAFPMLLHGPWGSGKSAFCAKLVALIDEKQQGKIQAVIFDAFKADHHDNPLMSLYASLEPLFPKDDQSVLQKVAMPVLRTSLNVIGRLSIGMLLKQIGLTQEELKEVTQGSQELLEQGIKAALDDQIQAEHNIQQFKMKLEELAGDNTLLVIVDELDRCRPSYAVSILETIKHIFDCKNVKFMLVTNKTQLEASIQHAYGVGLDAANYLEKFFAYQVNIPMVTNYPHSYGELTQNTATAHFSNLTYNSKVLKNGFLAESGTSEITFMHHLISVHKLSLRSIERLVTRLEIFQANTNSLKRSDDYLANSMLLTAIFIAHTNPELAAQLINGKDPKLQLLNFIGAEFPSIEGLSNMSISDRLMLYIFAKDQAIIEKSYGPLTPERERALNEMRKLQLPHSDPYSSFIKKLRDTIAAANLLN